MKDNFSYETYIHYNPCILYPQNSPYNPSVSYPEYLFDQDMLSHEKNLVYDSIRDILFNLDFDRKRYNTPDWNPLGEIIRPGDNVLVKPNMVYHFHPKGYTMDCLITHGSVMRAICDYVLIALEGKGRLTIGDAPIQSADFNQLVRINGIKDIIELYKGKFLDLKIELIDFRETIAIQNSRGHITQIKRQKNIDFEYVELGSESMFNGDSDEKYVVADYPEKKMLKYHSENKHTYLIPARLLEANVIINLPKPKTHRYSGMTGAMKNFIGINSRKENLPHYSRGSIKENGDEYPVKNLLKRISADLTDIIIRMANVKLYLLSLPLYLLRKILLLPFTKNEIFRGTWHGNDTIWRTIVDVNRIVLYADKVGKISETKQRIIFTIVDGIIAGEEEGPLEPSPNSLGVLISGFNLYTIDRIIATLMGYNFKFFPMLTNCPKDLGKQRDEDILIRSNNAEWDLKKLNEINIVKSFKPAPGWEILISNK